MLRASIDFFMHKKTICIYWILIFYIFIFLDVVIGYIALGDAAAAASLNNAGYYTTALNHFCIGIYYVFLQRLYVGCGGPWQLFLGVGVIQPHNDNHCLDRRPKYMHWSGSLRHFFRLAFLEVRAMLFGGSKESSSVRIPGSKKHQSATSFNHLLNIALKYMHRHCEISPLELQQSRRIYKAAFVGIFALYRTHLLFQYDQLRLYMHRYAFFDGVQVFNSEFFSYWRLRLERCRSVPVVRLHNHWSGRVDLRLLAGLLHGVLMDESLRRTAEGRRTRCGF